MLGFSKDIDDFVDGSMLYVPEDFQLTEEILDLLAVEQIIIYSGIYPVVISGGQGFTVVEADITN